MKNDPNRGGVYLLFAAFAALAGCAGPTRPAGPDMRGVERAEASVANAQAAISPTNRRGTPRVILMNEPVDSSALEARLSEAAGAVVLGEIALDKALARRMIEAGLSVEAAQLAAETTLLRQTIAAEARVSDADAGALVEDFRRARGLGPERFNDLLLRNARLRMLVRESIDISNTDIDRAVEVEFGPRCRIRIIVLRDQARALALRAELMGDASGSSLRERFIDAASQLSIDPSASRGGLVASVSAADVSVPSTYRTALRTLEPGALSPVLATDNAYALILLESRTPGRTDITDEERSRTEARLRLLREREAMERLSRQLGAQMNLTIFDRSLQWAWEARPAR